MPNQTQQALRAFRKECGLTLAELATRSGLHESTISRYERGSRGMSPQAMTEVQKQVAQVWEERLADNRRTLLRAEIALAQVLKGYRRAMAPFEGAYERAVQSTGASDSDWYIALATSR